MIILSDAINGQLVNIALRSKGDPPKSLQQKLRNAFVSNNDVQDENGLQSREDNVEEKIDYGEDEYIVQFYPSQVEVCNYIQYSCYTIISLLVTIFIN